MSHLKKIKMRDPGIYTNLSNDDYHSGPGISSSGIKLILDCPKKFYYQYILGNKQKETSSFKFGSVFHTAILESEKFRDYFVINDENRNSKSFKSFMEINSDKIIVKKKEFDSLNLMHDSIMSNASAKHILESTGDVESSCYWIDREPLYLDDEDSFAQEIENPGILCKIRPDKLSVINKHKIICDLKSAISAEPEKYSKAAFHPKHGFGYHISAAMYMEGMNALDDPRVSFVHIVTEKNPPHITEVYKIESETLDKGNQYFRKGLAIYAMCIKTGIWPGYTNGKINSIGLPKWAKE